MARYIDIDKALRSLHFSERLKYAELLNAQQIADVVEVVRCKDCAFHKSCSIEEAAMMDGDFFCSDGRRRDEEIH